MRDFSHWSPLDSFILTWLKCRVQPCHGSYSAIGVSFTLFSHSYSSFCGTHLGEPGSSDDHHCIIRKSRELQRTYLCCLVNLLPRPHAGNQADTDALSPRFQSELEVFRKDLNYHWCSTLNSMTFRSTSLRGSRKRNVNGVVLSHTQQW